jgi:hypothetical protein
MRIQDLQGVVKGIDSREARKAESTVDRASEKSSQSNDGDTLDVSLSSRVSALSADTAETIASQPDILAVERINEIQTRVNSGFYNQPATTAAIADRLLNFYGS